MTRIGYDLKQLYDYSLKEILFILKYRREGFAENWWAIGFANRAGNNAKSYPEKPKELFGYMYEKETSNKPVPIPDWLRDDYEQKINSRVKRGD